MNDAVVNAQARQLLALFQPLFASVGCNNNPAILDDFGNPYLIQNTLAL